MENRRILNIGLNLNRQIDNFVKIDSFGNFEKINLNETQFKMNYFCITYIIN